MQSDVSVVGNKITGTLHYLDSGSLVTTFGEGNFLALKFSDISENAVSCKVGLDPSMSTGLVEIIDDPDKNGGFLISDPTEQVFKVVSKTEDGKTLTQTFNLSELVLEQAENNEVVAEPTEPTEPTEP